MKFVTVGVVSRPHGLDGSFLVNSGTDSSLAKTSSLFFSDGKDTHGPYEIIEKTYMPSKGWKLRLRNVAKMESISRWVGATVLIERRSLPALPAGQYYTEEIVGLAVFEKDRQIGVVSSIESVRVAPDRWWVRLDTGGTLAVPAVSHFVIEVDIKAARILVKNTESLK